MNPIQNIVDWNISRNLVHYSPTAEYNILASEVDEYVTSLINSEDPVDDLADIIVVAIGTLYKLGYDPSLVLTEVHKEISSRIGAINPATGKWEKNKNQLPSELYQANYATCRR